MSDRDSCASAISVKVAFSDVPGNWDLGCVQLEYMFEAYWAN